ncbi:MAG: hypothetical protein V3574_02495 [Candidatus Moraniibacteriota bacterium]
MYKNIAIVLLTLCLAVFFSYFYKQKAQIERELWNAKIEKIESAFGTLLLVVELTDFIDNKELAEIGKSEAWKILKTLNEMTNSPKEFRVRVEKINEDFEKNSPEVALENLRLFMIPLHKEM